MRRSILIIAALAALGTASGCDKLGAKPPAAAAKAGDEHAGHDHAGHDHAAHAGKGEAAEADMCREHGVLESLCTKCNPKLAPIFQTKGDWCKEHGLPESVCPICHPDRRGRPAVDVAGDEAPADGTKVILKTAEAARVAGIETVKVTAGGMAATGIVAPVTLVYDGARVAQVTARASGVIKRVNVDVGASVGTGAVLATVESAAVSTDQSRLGAVRSRVAMLETNWRRESDLEKKGISSRKEVLAAEQELREGRAELESLQASLRGVGAGGTGGRYTIKAPFGGIVTQRTASVEQHVDPQTPLFEIVNTSSLFAEVAVAEKDLALVKAGTAVVITLDAVPGKEFRGTIAQLAPFVDPQTRTAKARVRLQNGGGLLRANMYGQARIAVKGAKAAVAVPQGAVQHMKGADFVFVQLAPNEFEARRVEQGVRAGGNRVELKSGVTPGEAVVTAGGFFLKTEMLKDSIGAGCCEAGGKQEK